MDGIDGHRPRPLYKMGDLRPFALAHGTNWKESPIIEVWLPMTYHFVLESRAILAKMTVSERVRAVLVSGKNKGVGHPRFFRVLKGV
jgi:hypothetical protein